MKYTRKTVDTWQVLTYIHQSKCWVMDYLYYVEERANSRCNDLLSCGYRARVVKKRRREV